MKVKVGGKYGRLGNKYAYSIYTQRVLENNHVKDTITAEERRLIDEAIAAGRVTRLPLGAPEPDRVAGARKKNRDVPPRASVTSALSNSLRRLERERKEGKRG